MKPNKNQILVKPFPSEEESEGGIFIPESVREVSNKMQVVEVGEGTKKTPMYFKKGQVVHKVKSNGETTWCHEFIINGEKHYLIGQDAVLSIEK